MFALAFLDEDDEANVFALPSGVELQGLIGRIRSRAAGTGNADFAQFADDRGVVQIFAGVFPSLHIGVQPSFGNGEPNFGRVVRSGIGKRDDLDVEELLSVRPRLATDDADVGFLSGGGALDGIDGLLGAAADEFVMAVDDHLRRVGIALSDGAGVNVLTKR